MAAYQAFHARAASAIRGGDALTPSATGMRITGGPDAPTVTDGPFAECAEVAGGYYVFEAQNLDEALALARDIPAAKYGAVEVWPIVEYFQPSKPVGNSWLALLFEPPANAPAPGTPEREPASWSIRNSARQPGNGPTAALPCIRRQRPRLCVCATASAVDRYPQGLDCAGSDPARRFVRRRLHECAGGKNASDPYNS